MKILYVALFLGLMTACGQADDPPAESIDVAIWDKETQALPGPQRVIDWPDIRAAEDRKQRHKWNLIMRKDSQAILWLQETRKTFCGTPKQVFALSLLDFHTNACGLKSVFAGFAPDGINYPLPIMSCKDRVERDDGRGVPKRMLIDGVEVYTQMTIGLDELSDFEQGGDSFIGVDADVINEEKPTDIYLRINYFDGQTRLVRQSIPEPPIQCAYDINFQEACGKERTPMRMRPPPRNSAIKQKPLDRVLCCEFNIDPSYPECQR